MLEEKIEDQETERPNIFSDAETLAADNLSACGAVTREKTVLCNSLVDAFFNTMNEAAKAEVTILSVGGDCPLAVAKIVWTDNNNNIREEILFSVTPQQVPSGPHTVKVPAKRALNISCGTEPKGNCTVKYTFRWQ